ncbi:hypothetical protein OHC33_008793 [Knufia fluminis]|uniref:Peptidase A1 domain-containing protein n=1 Tax=Knufia fluminis TaxID=191047 RepID=A0AAN8EF54_9EURO|nr:hypothetical protein OHC33_008793 [Knufia fluminis]
MFTISSSLLLLTISTIPKLVIAAPHNGRDVQSPYSHSSQTIELKAVKHDARAPLHHTTNIRARSSQYTSSNNETSVLAGHAPYFAAPVTIGSQTFNLVVDTGSSDTWVADSFFTCMKYGTPVSQAYCELDLTFVNDGDGNWVTPATNWSFFLSYADGSYVGGPMGLAQINLTSDISLSQFTGFASALSWDGGNLTSGMLGLGYSAGTSMYHSTDFWDHIPCSIETPGMGIDSQGNSVQCTQQTYSGVAETLMSSNTLNGNNQFSLALSRDSSNTSTGGLLTFGGTPDYHLPTVNLSSSFVESPIKPLAYDPTNTTRYYSISIDGFSFPAFTNYSSTTTTTSYTPSFTDDASGSSSSSSHKLKLTHTRRTTTSKTYTLSESDGTTQFIVDSGTEVTTIPRLYAETFNSLFNPPAERYSGVYYLNCTTLSYIPPFGITIAGQTFYHNPEDLVLRRPSTTWDYELQEYVDSEVCLSAIADADQVGGGYTLNILGQPTLKNVLAVFDVGNSKMGFAARPYYES